MKLDDYIKIAISEYPFLYADKDWESSRLEVIDHLFLVLGNGLEWAHTEKPEDGGYLIERQWENVDGEWVEKYDPPYGQVKYEGPPIERYFNEDICVIKKVDKSWCEKYKRAVPMLCDEVWEGFTSEVPEDLLKLSYQEDDPYDPQSPKKYVFASGNTHRRFKESMSKTLPEVRAWRPYPFAAKYWPLAEIDPKLIKPDWREGMIEVKKKALDYYRNLTLENRSMYDGKPEDYLKQFEKYETVSDLAKAYEVKLPGFRGPISLMNGKEKQHLATTLFETRFFKDREERIAALENAISVLEAL